MKKNVLVILAVMFVIAFVSPAFAEELVPSAPGITKDEAQSLVQEIVKKGATAPISSLEARLFGNKKKGKKGILDEIREDVSKKDNATAKAIGDLTKEDGVLSGIKNAQEVLNKKLLGGNGEFEKTRQHTTAVGKEIYGHISGVQSTAGMWGIINLVAILLIGAAVIALLVLLFNRARRDDEKAGPADAE